MLLEYKLLVCVKTFPFIRFVNENINSSAQYELSLVCDGTNNKIN